MNLYKKTLTVFFVLIAQIAYSQNFSCNYYGYAFNEKVICNQFGYQSRTEAIKAVEEIVRRSGLKQNFYVMECPAIDNCFATTRDGERLIVYDAAFMNRVNNLSKTDWAAHSILAHEIGHHLQGHTLKPGGSDHGKELEADEFSGFVMYQLGATLKEAQSAMWRLSSDYETSTHPKRSQRLAAIEKGYKAAMTLYPSIQKTSSTTISKETSVETPTHEEVMPNATELKTGCVIGDCKSGYGVAINRYTNEKYTGEWANGMRSGKGVEFYKSGQRKYEGYFEQGRYNGYGKYFFPNGDRYEGHFAKGDMHDLQGNYYYKNGNRLTVRYENGQKQGKAKLITNDGSIRIITYKNDQLVK